MRVLSIVAAVVVVGAVGAYLVAGRTTPTSAGEFVSGPQAGSKVPGAFEPLNINGPDAGDEACLFCKYGNAPVVMVFATKPTDGLAAFVRQLEKAAADAAKSAEVGACVVVTDTSDDTRKALGKLADKDNLKQVIVAVIDAPQLKAYKLHAEAEVTVLLYSKQVVRLNKAFRAGEFTEKAAGELATDVANHYSTK
jgi:hypothetical protein